MKWYPVLALLFLLAFPGSGLCEEPTVHHIVLFDLRDDATPEQIEDMIATGEELIAGIPGVLDVSINYKARDDREVHIADYDIAMHVLWQDNATGDIYAPHEKHQAFMGAFGPLVESIRVIDFYGNE